MIDRACLNARGWARGWALGLALGVSICLVMAAPHLGQAWAQQELFPTTDGPFGDAIRTAHLKTVKVYGATAGRVDGYASGMIVSPDGHILTMQGVFLEGNRVRVVMHDGSSHTAAVLRRDRTLQVALLKIEAETPNYFDVAGEDHVAKGDWVIAVSNAFRVAEGVEPLSVNLGVVSLHTSIEARISPRDVAYSGPMILIDAITSNPGAAGGAAVDIEGNLIGMIGKVINSSETNTRLNYAVPSSALSRFLAGEQTVADAETTPAAGVPGDLGIHLFRLGGRRAPAYIDRVESGSPAAEAGLRPDDLVIGLAGEKVATIDDYDRIMETVTAGQDVIVLVTRGTRIIRTPLTAVEKN